MKERIRVFTDGKGNFAYMPVNDNAGKILTPFLSMRKDDEMPQRNCGNNNLPPPPSSGHGGMTDIS